MLWTNVVRGVKAVALIVLVIVAAILMRPRRAKQGVLGGGERNPNIIVDTLNLTHAVFGGGAVTPEKIVAAIDYSASRLRHLFPGRVVYVLKGKESEKADEPTLELYKAAARRNCVTVCMLEQHESPPAVGSARGAPHAAKGRDDFFTAIMSKRLSGAPVLTNDKFKDFGEFRQHVQPFFVREFVYWKDLPIEDSIRPDSLAYSRLKKPRTIKIESVLPEVLDGCPAFPKTETRDC